MGRSRLSRLQRRSGRALGARHGSRSRCGGALAQGGRPQGRRRRGPSRRVLVRRLPPLRSDGALLAGDGERGPLRGGWRARARHLQRLPDPLRGGAAPRRAGTQPLTHLRLSARSACASRTPTTAFTRLCRRGEILEIPIKHGEGCYFADDRDARGARGARPGALPLRRRRRGGDYDGEPQRLAPLDRRRDERARQRLRHDAASRARRGFRPWGAATARSCFAR